ncbi:MAG: 3-hydroxyacyl-CoA dehydrogenase NAD-binding domain-containing protein [Acidiferrobacterales bacterium]
MKHWRLEKIDNSLALIMNMADRSANVLSSEVMHELEEALADVNTRSQKGETVNGLMILSGKDKSFILGADVAEFQNVKNVTMATEFVRRGQQVLNKIAAMSIPTVAVIHGNCLGGGTELALACDYRVASDDNSTRIGLPEVNLGIHPGFAGTVRLPKLVGPFAAFNIMLTGRPLRARAAKHIGLVDDVVAQRHLERAALAFIKKKPRKHRPAWWLRALSLLPLRSLVANLVRKQLRKKVRKDQYPAPYRMIDLWVRGANQEKEASSISELVVSDVSRNLVQLFLSSEELKRTGRRVTHGIKHVHVIGAGVMGGDIAAWAALNGFRVSLQDMNEDSIARAIKRAHQLYKKRLKKPRDIEEAMDRLMPDNRGDGLRHADLVIEAVVEKLEVKRNIFQQAEAVTGDNAILATNTSSIPLEEIGEGLKDPSRLVGLHFFNPVAKMQLVEVVCGDKTSDSIMGRARAFAVAIGRLPLDVKSSPGFLVNRILMPYLMEAMSMVEEGIPQADIDRAALDFGMPMGPIHLADTVGLDICLSVAEELAGPLGMEVPARLRTMVEAGSLGKKSGSGFYQYKNGKSVRSRGNVRKDIPIVDRLVLRQLNETVACLREKVVLDTDATDVGMVFGTGFAPFRGGPIHYARSEGIDEIKHRLLRLVEAYGDRFAPDDGWAEIKLSA